MTLATHSVLHLLWYILLSGDRRNLPYDSLLEHKDKSTSFAADRLFKLLAGVTNTSGVTIKDFCHNCQGDIVVANSGTAMV